MKNKQVVFISGTPGVGKTTIADHLNKKLNIQFNSKLFKINEIAISNNLIKGEDLEKKYKIIDIDEVDKKLFEIINEDHNQKETTNNTYFKSNSLRIIDSNTKNFDRDDFEIIIVEGHVTHLCNNCDKIIVLRLDPNLLEVRLNERNYSKAKIQENLEAEALGVCSIEAYEKHEELVNEIDTTNKTIDEIIKSIESVIFDNKSFPVEEIDFMDWFIS